MRGAVVEIGSSVDRNIALMGEGAERMRQAAEQFTNSGGAIADVFDRSRHVATELSQSAARLSGASQDIEAVARDYQQARETFAGIVETLKSTVDTAKRDVAMTSELVKRLDAAAQKLVAVQGQADEYLAKLNRVLEGAHSLFCDQMLATVRKTNGEFHASLSTNGLTRQYAT
jgi:ABC-type transporter Mla subunit MlaD